jgi:hypothetical protein
MSMLSLKRVGGSGGVEDEGNRDEEIGMREIGMMSQEGVKLRKKFLMGSHIWKN